MPFNQAHSGAFGAHLSDCKVFSKVGRHYWWCTIRSDITKWSCGCLVCTTQEAGRAYRAPLTPIPVSGPFHRVGVYIIQFPRSRQGNQYVWSLWIISLSDPKSSQFQTNQQLEEIVSRHGVPVEVLSDRWRGFLSEKLRNYWGSTR